MRKFWPLFLLTACGDLESLQTRPCEDVGPGEAVTCSVEGWDERDYDMVVPERTAPQAGYPVVVVFHGGAGDRKDALRHTCPWGRIDAPECLHAMGNERGYVVVAPDGTPNGIFTGRSWNAGGGQGPWRCVSGEACEDGVNEAAYFDALLDDVASRVTIDRNRVFLTGISAGAALSHRLACERAEAIAGIAPVAGALQFVTNETCNPSRPVAILQIHGSEDPCWRYAGGETDCPIGQADAQHIGVESSMTQWAGMYGCTGEPLEDFLPDVADDRTRTTRRVWDGCGTSLQLLRVDGGGHTWPNGYAYLSESTIGRINRDWGNEVLLGFFDRFP